MSKSYTLKVACPDQSGLIADVSRTVAESGGNILHLSQYTAVDINAFFMKMQFETGDDFDVSRFESAFVPLSERLRMDWKLYDRARRQRVAILVSKTSHCLYELLLKHQDGDLDCDIPVIVSNHPDLASVATQFHIPFYKVDPEKGKAAYEADVEGILKDYGVDLIVLARYMQVLSGELVGRWERRVINIHHGFLPAFQGAKPYHQAWAKGVKIIGATAHFRVSDTRSISEFIRLGKDVERKVLYEALRLHLDNSVFVREGRTFIIQ
jgi:formyltetrahydrofolate deformylase